jgi:hypothetical protein
MVTDGARVARPGGIIGGHEGSIVRRGGARVDVGGEELGGDEVSQVVEPDMAEAEPVAERCSATKPLVNALVRTCCAKTVDRDA